MQENVQDKFIYVQDIIDEMKKRGWKPARLSKEAKVSEASISRCNKIYLVIPDKK